MVTVDLLRHARTAIERAASDLDRIRAELSRNAPSMSRLHRQGLEENARDLSRQLSLLEDRFHDMARAGTAELPVLWRHFFVAYDDYLETARRARCSLAREEYVDAPGVPAPVAPAPNAD